MTMNRIRLAIIRFQYQRLARRMARDENAAMALIGEMNRVCAQIAKQMTAKAF